MENTMDGKEMDAPPRKVTVAAIATKMLCGCFSCDSLWEPRETHIRGHGARGDIFS